VDVFRLAPSEHLTQNEIDAATLVHATQFNAQEQPKVSWPASPVVAKAYVDQLVRSKAIAADRAAALRLALDRSDKAQLVMLAGQLEGAASGARGSDAARLRSLATTITDLTSKMR
jgi:hypothetical protein